MRGLVYTAIFGGRDQLHSIIHVEPGVDYVAYVDQPYPHAKGWEQVRKPVIDHNPRLTARSFKIAIPEDGKYDWMLWCDGSHIPKIPLKDRIEKVWLNNNDAALHGHPARECAYLEAKECARIKKDKPENIQKIVDRMKMAGYPQGHGLHATPTMVRRVNDKTMAHAKEWWECVSTCSVRDQTSFDFLAWKHGLKVFTIAGHCYESDRYKYHGGH